MLHRPSSSIKAGSQLATAAGLAFYTVRSDNTIDGTNAVSIGLHYLGLGTNYTTGGVPDWWLLNYFGTLSVDTSADYDGTGYSVLYDYTYQIDPNMVTFDISATNQFDRANTVPLQLLIHTGTPYYMAAQVDILNSNSAAN